MCIRDRRRAPGLLRRARLRESALELGQLLAAVRPDHPPTVGVGPREEAAEVAGAQPGVEALVVGDHHVPVGTGTGEGGAVLLVAAPVRDRVLGVGEERGCAGRDACRRLGNVA